LSVSTPSVVGWAQTERREMARRINEYTADLVADRPGQVPRRSGIRAAVGRTRPPPRRRIRVSWRYPLCDQASRDPR
jgi:hypothetical protein